MVVAFEINVLFNVHPLCYVPPYTYTPLYMFFKQVTFVLYVYNIDILDKYIELN